MSEQVLEPPRIDPNGVPILKGYRPPFNSETGKLNSIKGMEAKRNKKQARLLAASQISTIPSDVVEIAAKLASLKRAHSRCIAASVASNSGREAAQWMRAAKDALEQLQSILGQSRKPTKKPHLHGEPSTSKPMVKPIAPVAKNASQVKPVPSGNQGVNPTAARPAPVKAAISPDPEIDDDCPF